MLREFSVTPAAKSRRQSKSGAAIAWPGGRGNAMNMDSLSTTALVELNKVCETFKAAWKTGPRPRIEDYLGLRTGQDRAAALQILLEIEIELRTRAGERPDRHEYEARFQQAGDVIRGVFDRLERDADVEMLRPGTTEPARPDDQDATVPGAIEPAAQDLADLTAPEATLGAPPFPTAAHDQGGTHEIPEFIGRYRVERLLGRGNFLVYLASDPDLGRQVAIKVARQDDSTGRRRMTSLAEEALKLEGLHHPRIVKLYEHVLCCEGAGRDGFIVLEYVEGQTLEQLLRAGRPEPRRLAAIVAMVADTVHHAHTHASRTGAPRPEAFEHLARPPGRSARLRFRPGRR